MIRSLDKHGLCFRCRAGYMILRRNRFDHHQESFDLARGNGIKYSFIRASHGSISGKKLLVAKRSGRKLGQANNSADRCRRQRVRNLSIAILKGYRRILFPIIYFAYNSTWREEADTKADSLKLLNLLFSRQKRCFREK